MKWLVTINSEGIQCQVPVGKNISAAAAEEKSLENRAQIVFIFKHATAPPKPGSWDISPVFVRAWSDEKAKARRVLHKKYGAATPGEISGYNLRKQYAMGDGVEVLADLDAKDYDEFRKKYSGFDGAIGVLERTEKVMSGAGKDPAKTINKLIRKLEIEAED